MNIINIYGRFGVIVAEAMVSDEDFALVNQYRWHLNTSGYARTTQTGRTSITMHRLIMGEAPMVDHINGDKLDNRRDNLRTTSPSENAMNRTKRRGCSSMYKGVCASKSGTWITQVSKAGKRLFRAVYETEVEAAIAYDQEALKVFGEHAHLNFSDSAARPTPVPRRQKQSEYPLETAPELLVRPQRITAPRLAHPIENSTYRVPIFGRYGKIRDYAKVDSEDFEMVNQYRWIIHSGYAVTMTHESGRRLSMHRLLLGKSAQVVDHINRDRLDNRRSNLRPATHQQNSHNRASKVASSSQYKGVCKRHGLFLAQLKRGGEHLLNAYYDNEIDAAVAYDQKAREVAGEFAFQNFPDSATRPTPVPHTRPIINKRKPGRLGFRGVKEDRGRYYAYIHEPSTKKQVSLGGFDTPEEAARAHDKAAVLRHGNKAITNFPQ